MWVFFVKIYKQRITQKKKPEPAHQKKKPEPEPAHQKKKPEPEPAHPKKEAGAGTSPPK